MKLRNRIGFVLAVGCIALVGAQLVAGPKPVEPKKDADKPAARAYTPVLTVEQTMEGQGSLMKSIKSGLLDGAWDNAEKSALVLAELSSTNQYHNDAKDYKGWARELSKTSMELAAALKKRDEDGSKKLMKRAGDTCSACHEVYKKKW